MHSHAEHQTSVEHYKYDVQASLIKELAGNEVFASDAPISQYLEQKVVALCGDAIEPPTLYVVDDEDPNACVIGDSLIVSSGIFKLVEHEEEVDAILAHELVHSHEDHGSTEATSHAGLLGITRAHEIEADIRAMTLMSNKGSNPRGMISMFEKLDAYQRTLAGKALEDPGSIWARVGAIVPETASPTHGASSERAVNVEQAAWLFDMPNLSTEPLTTLTFDATFTGNTESEPPQDDIVRRQAAVIRAAKKHLQSGILNIDDMPTLLEKQVQILTDAEPLLDSERTHRAARLTFFKFGIPTSFKDTLARTEDTHDLLRDTVDPRILSTIGSFTSGDQYKLAEKCLYEDIRRGNYTKIADTIRLANSLGGLDRFCGNDAVEAFVSEFKPTQTQLVELGKALGTCRFPLGHFNKKKATYEDLQKLSKIAAVSRIEAHPPLRDIIENTRALAAFEQQGADLTSLENFLESFSYEYTLWTEFKNGFSAKELRNLNRSGGGTLNQIGAEASQNRHADYAKRRRIEEFNGLPAEERLYRSCLEITPTHFASQLLARADLTPKEQQATATLWCRAYTDIHGAAADRMLELLPLLITATPELTPDAVGAIIRRRMFSHMEATFGKRLKDDVNAAPFDINGHEVNVTADFRIRHALKTSTSVLRKTMTAHMTGDTRAERNEFVDSLVHTSEDFRAFKTIAALEVLAHNKNPNALIELVRQTTPTGLSVKSFSERPYYEYARVCWDKAVNSLIKDPHFAQDDAKLHALIALGVMSEDVTVNMHVPAQALGILVERSSFEEAMKLVFEDYAHLPGHVMRHAVESIIEHKAKTAEDFAIVEEHMMQYLGSFIDTHQANIGVGSIIETNVISAYKREHDIQRSVGLKHDDITGMESVRLIKALLMSSKSDVDLKQYVFERWWLANRSRSKVSEHFTVEDIAIWRHPSKTARREYWINDMPPVGTYTPLADTIDKLYLANDSVRYIAVRKLMLGEGGVLTDEPGRESLVEALMQSWLEYEEGSEGERLLRNILSSLMQSAPPERLYHYLGPILQDLILRPPQKQSTNDAVATAHAQKIIDSMVRREKLGTRLFGTELDAVNRKIRNLMDGGSKNTQNTVNLSATHDKLLELFEDSRAEPITTISPTELALMTGKKSGAIGVRMLQLAGQYYPIPADEREKYNEVYDSMKGQSRLQAFKVFTREARRSPQTAAILADVADFGQRIGGGSLMTMYEVTMTNGTKRVLGARNPNAEYHVVQVADLASSALNQASANDPNNNDLKMAQSLITDSVTWISRELNDASFTAKDTVFRAQNDTIQGNGFRKGSSRYDVYVPQAYETGSLWVRHEDFVPGVNLTSLIVSDDKATDLEQKVIGRSDFQDATSTLVRNALHQINHGDFVHSDMHKGNFRITEGNNAIAVFDRYNLIEMTAPLRSALQTTIGSIISGDRVTAVQAMINYVAPHNAGNGNLASQIAASIEQETDPTKAMTHTLLDLKKAGITIPIELSLILRNIFCLSRLSEEAGFANIGAAFLHTADEQEVQDLLTAISGE